MRANATAIDVPSSMLDVVVAATARGRNGSCSVSAVNAPSYPTSSSALACAPTSSRAPLTMLSTFTATP